MLEMRRLLRAISGAQNSVRQLTILFVASVGVNYPWERLQSRFYVDPIGGGISRWLCLIASLADGVLILIIFGIGVMTFGRRTWFEQPGISGYVMMFASGLTISIGIEWATVNQMRWWRYTEDMPLVPLIGIGAVPVAQMLILPPVIFSLAATLNRCIWKRDKKSFETQEHL